MGCSAMKQKKFNNHKYSQSMLQPQSKQDTLNPVLKEESYTQRNNNENIEKQFQINDVRPSLKLLSQLRDKQSKKMETLKYNSQYIEELLGDDNQCIYVKKVDHLTQSAENHSTFSSPSKRQLVQKETKSLKTIRKKTKGNLKNIF